jgi:hypothetical protein
MAVDGRLRGSERETALEARVTSRSFRPRGSLTGAPLRWGEGEVLALQRRVGNDAVRTLAEGQVVLQRQLPFLVPALIGLAGYGAYKALGGGGGEPAPTPAATPTPDPVLQALAKEGWENGVSKPIEEAHRDLAGPRPDYAEALAAVHRAREPVQAARDALPDDDPRRVDAIQVIGYLGAVAAYLDGKLGTVSDQQTAGFLKAIYTKAGLLGQELGVVTEPSVLASEVVVTP